MSFSMFGCLAQALLAISTLNGTVVDTQGHAVAGAHVFVEAGLAAPLQETTAGPDGTFRFDDLGTGDTGVFAFAEGHALGGQHLNIAVEDSPPPLTIRLGEPDTIAGKVLGGKDTPVAGAMVTRIALLGTEKVGIPLSKLKEFGVAVPTSDADGRFTVPMLPKGGTVALKFTHPQFAVEGLNDVSVGQGNLKVQLYLGILVEGDVVARGDGQPIANAPLLLRNAQPPHDTTLTNSDSRGKFSVRLKPGVYLYQAAGAALQSAGWSKLVLQGDEPTARIRVVVAGTGTIRGEVRDAKTERPIVGARVSLSTNGIRAAVERTGPTGVFQFNASAGENIVRLEVAQGFQPPVGGNSVKLTLNEGQTVDLPGMWLAPLPSFRLQVVDDTMVPVPGALVRLVQPEQFGVRVSGADGWVDLNIGSLPPGGALLGLVESAEGTRGALFRLEPKDAGGATVQLMPLASLRGRVVNTRDKGIPGVIVGGAFPGTEASADPVLLWKTVSGADGTFAWNGVLPGVPQFVIARVGTGKVAQATAFNLAPGEQKPLPALAVEGTSRNIPSAPDHINLDDFPSVCGPARATAAKTIVIFCAASEVGTTAESLAGFLKALPSDHLAACVVASPRPDCDNTPVPVLSGRAPGLARTLVLGSEGQVLLQSFGLPPAFALRELP